MNTIVLIIVVLFSGAGIAFISSGILYFYLRKQKVELPEIKEFMGMIRRGSWAYLRQQYKLFSIILSVLVAILILMYSRDFISGYTIFAAATGALFSMLAGAVGVSISTQINGLIAQKSFKSLKSAKNVSLMGGAVAGLFTNAILLFDLALWWLILYLFEGGGTLTTDHQIVAFIILVGLVTTTFGVGASSYALIARVGGGSYTKGADVGADNAGKIILGLEEDSALNPGTIADNVGDNVGDINGGFADLYETQVGTLISSTLLCGSSFASVGLSAEAVLLVMSLASFGVIASLVGMFFGIAKSDEEKPILRSQQRGLFIGSFLVAVFGFFAAKYTIGIVFWYPILIGLFVANAISVISEYYNSSAFRPVQRLAKLAQSGAASIVTGSIENGLRSAGMVLLFIALGIAVTVKVVPSGYELVAIALSATAMLSLFALILGQDAEGPMTDNAQGINEMVGAPEAAIKRTNILDSIGNTAAAKLKGFSIGSAAMTVLVMIGAYLEAVKMSMDKAGLDFDSLNFSLNNPDVIIGLFIGGAIIYIFTSEALKSVSKSAVAMIKNILEQSKRFLKNGQLVPGEKPDYDQCIVITTKEAQKVIFVPLILVFAGIIIPGIFGGPVMVTAVLVGLATTGVAHALFQSNTGGSADNSKKHIEAGFFGGKHSDAHKASVVADTVGDPLKDSSGPSINILMKLAAMIALVLANFTVDIYF